MVIFGMLHNKNAICQHHEDTLPFFLLDLRATEKVETGSQIDLVHPDEGRRENDGGGDVNVKVVTNTSDSIKLEYDYNVDREA